MLVLCCVWDIRFSFLLSLADGGGFSSDTPSVFCSINSMVSFETKPRFWGWKLLQIMMLPSPCFTGEMVLIQVWPLKLTQISLSVSAHTHTHTLVLSHGSSWAMFASSHAPQVCGAPSLHFTQTAGLTPASLITVMLWQREVWGTARPRKCFSGVTQLPLPAYWSSSAALCKQYFSGWGLNSEVLVDQ